MPSAGSCSCSWTPAAQPTVAIPAAQLGAPTLSHHAVQVRVLPGRSCSAALMSNHDEVSSYAPGGVCASNCFLEPHQQNVTERLTNVKFTVHFKDEYANDVDFVSLLAKQRQKQHELLCFTEPDGSSAEIFFAFVRYSSGRNLAVAVLAQYPNFTLSHRRSSVEESYVSLSFAINSGD
jgi:hypothetical protein